MKLTPPLMDWLPEHPIARVRSFLVTQGWAIAAERPDHSTTWTLSTARGTAEVVVPARADLQDFVRRMEEVVFTIAKATDRDVYHVLYDIAQFPFDVLRVSIDSIPVQDGTIALDDGARLLSAAHGMLGAAASSAVELRSVFPTRRPGEADAYLRRVRLGGTERGSFRAILLSPVPPPTSAPLPFSEGEVPDDDPFARRAVLTLFGGLRAAQEAALESVRTGDYAPFDAGLQAGVSANLCESIVEALSLESGGNLGVQVTWSPRRTAPASGPLTIRIASDLKGPLHLGSEHLRQQRPVPGVDVEGPVTKLNRPDGSMDGDIAMRALVGGRLREVRVHLTYPDYQLAIKAHSAGNVIQCSGTLETTGKFLRLRNVQGIAIVEDE